VIFMKIQACIM